MNTCPAVCKPRTLSGYRFRWSIGWHLALAHGSGVNRRSGTEEQGTEEMKFITVPRYFNFLGIMYTSTPASEPGAAREDPPKSYHDHVGFSCLIETFAVGLWNWLSASSVAPRP